MGMTDDMRMTNKIDIIILGGGISGLMVAKKLGSLFQDMSICIIDLNETCDGGKDHLFHLHESIPELGIGSDFLDTKPEKINTSVWDGKEIKQSISIEDCNKYSLKIFKELRITNINNLKEHTSYPISKKDLAYKLAKHSTAEKVWGKITEIDTANKLVRIDHMDTHHPFINWSYEYKYLVSTIALPSMLKLAGINTGIEFVAHPFYSATLKLNNKTHCYQALMNTDEFCNTTRVSLMDDILHIESIKEVLLDRDYAILEKAFGVKGCTLVFKEIYPGRINPLPKKIRKPLMHWLTGEHNIFCIGRYGIWSYKVATTVWKEDIKVIADLIDAKNQSMKFSKGIQYDKN